MKGIHIMSANPQNQSTDSQIPNGGFVWNRLRSEREEVCEALLRNARRSEQTSTASSETHSEEPILNAFEQKRDHLLQTRLRLIDEALDRLAGGKYGECSICGKWIENTKLDADPAFPFCCGCQRKSESEHRFESLAVSATAG